MSGYLEIIIGPMFSGKTSYLIDIYKKNEIFDTLPKVINYSLDTRYDDKMLSSHDLVKIPCSFASKIKDELEYCMNSDVILINEGQFFKDIVEWVKCAVEKQHKKVYICGLDGDFKREVFGNWLDLIPFCDEVTKLRSYCGCCKKRPALFTYRKTDAQEQELITATAFKRRSKAS